MAVVDLVMPKLGESIIEATVLKWLKNVGDTVRIDETVLEIATDKVDTEVPSTAEGIITEVLYKENDVVPIDAVIARIETNKAAPQASSETADKKIEEVLTPKVVEDIKATPTVATQAEQKPKEKSKTAKFYSPLVLNIAASEGVALSELEQLDGTGNDGRVTKNDLLNYIAKGKANIEPKVIATSSQYSGSNVEIIEMDRMRKLIAEHMVRSVQTSPHVTSFSEADVTNIVRWRESVKKDFEIREGTKITFMPLFIEAIIKCIKKYPLINSSIDGNKIIIKKDINIGMATALPNGNLIVPVIKNADQLNLVGLAKRVNDLAKAARNGKLKADDTQSGTFTLTNVGTFGSLMGTPIINQPQAAIMAVGAIKKRPMVIETAEGDSIAIRHMMYLSMSYDHRIIDGSLGAAFVTAVANELEAFKPNEA